MAGLRERFPWGAPPPRAPPGGGAAPFPGPAPAGPPLSGPPAGPPPATNKRAAVVMLPLLDVLQSIPILGFFPAALVFFVSTFQGSPVGLEVAVIFLIFPSMAWNMAFGVYESLSTIPHDLEDAAASFGVRDWLRFRRQS